MNAKPLYVAVAVTVAYAVASALGLERGVAAVAGGEPSPVLALTGVAFLALRLGTVVLVPILLLGCVSGELAARVWERR
jgi:hypothetical protein